MKHFPLARQSGRVALLLGVLDGTVQEQELKYAVNEDIQPRPRVKPVVAGHKRYESVTAAAKAFRQSGHPLWQEYQVKYRTDPERLRAVARVISYRATRDTFPGFYWV